ncbi:MULTISPECIES: response regulator [Pseudomonas]|jgi:DNA-binding response OmpR family regulator|uniref:Response regulator receiver domain-containing protein n=1 Tax=Pseudomonas syringae TaxID=317 RepID=A0AB37ZPQ5_PSESX|nr:MULTISPECIES: response regulator [Pseudomonas]ALD99942.1 chemotaxis protein CheY [Pseudomonas syringae UMAF0158]ELQ10331.1 response regulator receiver [Pseudomonas syringae BRIP39023]KPB28084.1 Response regulator receiver [Pseudomonas syringae pv. syringae]KTC11858.1 chemotaxis protein CheY [Pseudomonas sp. ICMP 10191]MBC9741311.1 response regulator [Pseudomonas syringae pv. syringae]
MSSESEDQTSLPKVLLVEDETMLATLMEMMLDDLGFATAYHASTLNEGIEYARNGEYDLAILDINIIGGDSFPIAAAIADRGIPFMFCSGYGRLGIPDAWLDRRCVAKPFSAEQLSQALSELLET